MITFCTVITDASHCPATNAGGWACWITASQRQGKHTYGEPVRFKRYGAFKDLVESAHEAEIKAILNGCTLAVNNFAPECIHVVSDCISAMDYLQKKPQWKAKLAAIVGPAQVTFKHVKAHTKVQDPRSFVNRWCDEKAKEAMKERRAAEKREASE